MNVLAFALILGGCGGAQPSRLDANTLAAQAAPIEPTARTPGQSASPSTTPAADDVASHGAAGRSSPVGQSETTAGKASVEAESAAPPTPSADVAVVDEPLYFPGARTRPKGSAIEVSLDDEIIATWNRGGLSAEPTPGPKGKPAHAAPRVKVDVTDVRGDVSEADMQRAARLKSYWPFRICYEQGLRRSQKLHGSIKLRLTIGPNGHPSGVQQLAAELGDAAVVGCVIKSAMGLGLPAPANGAPQITLDISLWPGDDPVTVKSGPRGKTAAPADVKAITDQLRAHLPDAKACFAAGLTRHDGLWGRLALSLHISGGAVAHVSEVESHFPDAEVTECVRNAFLKAAIASADRELTIVYPLRLGHAPDGREPRR